MTHRPFQCKAGGFPWKSARQVQILCPTATSCWMIHASVDMYATVYIIWQLQNEDFSKLFICRQTSGNKSFSLPTGGELQFLLKGQGKSLFLFANFQSKKLLQSLSMVANQFFSVSPAWKSPMDFYWFNFCLFTQFLFFFIRLIFIISCSHFWCPNCPKFGQQLLLHADWLLCLLRCPIILCVLSCLGHMEMSWVYLVTPTT